MGGDDKEKEGKGFTGLSSLLADGDATTAASAKNSGSVATAAPMETVGEKDLPQPPLLPQHQPPPPADPPTVTQSQSIERPVSQTPVQTSSGESSGSKWVLGIFAVIGAFWLFGRANEDTASSAPAYTPSVESQVSSEPSPAQPLTPTRPEESMPPVGQDRILSLAQIRYCLAEEIRMHGAESNLMANNQSDIGRFNAMVVDYNSRCGQFRYQPGSLESARRDVDQYRAQLLLDGGNRFEYSQQPSDSQSGDLVVSESSVAPARAGSPTQAPRQAARNARARQSQPAATFAPDERSYETEDSRALERLSNAHANQARQRAESEQISSTPGAHKRWDYKTGRDIWVDVNGNPIE